MGNAGRDQGYLGIDTNILVSFLDKRHPDHKNAKKIENLSTSVNPTIIHEAFHVLVFKQKWKHQTAKNTLIDYIDLDTVKFLNQTKFIAKLGLRIGTRYKLKGRDSLILANLLANYIQKLVTFDGELLRVKEVRDNNRILKIIPIEDL